MCCVILQCCSTQKQATTTERVVVQRDSIYKTLVQHDTLMQRDSVYIEHKGDTVYQYKYRYLYRTQLSRDTIFAERTDTVRVTKPIYIEKKLTKWQSIKQEVGGIAISAMLIVLIAAVVWLIKKYRK
jgi:hypothetical protein